jgi:hypothetical protein
MQLIASIWIHVLATTARVGGVACVSLALAVWPLVWPETILAESGSGQASTEAHELLKRLIERMEQMERQHQAEREEMKRRIEHLEKALRGTGAGPAHAQSEPPEKERAVAASLPPDPETSLRVNIRKPDRYTACPGFLGCTPEPHLEQEIPAPAKGPGWELDLLGYARWRFNIHHNFSDVVNTVPGDTGHIAGKTTKNSSGASFGGNVLGTDASRQNHFIRYTDIRGYVSTALKKDPFMLVYSFDFAGDEFNDGVLLGNDTGPLAAAGQRQFQVNTQLFYLQYDGWATVRLGRIPGHLGHGILGHIVRDGVTVIKPVTDRLGLQTTWVHGSTGRTISNQAGTTFLPFTGTSVSQSSETAQQKVQDLTGKEENLEGILLLGNYKLTPSHRAQGFLWRMWDTTAAGLNKQNQYVDLNGAGVFDLKADGMVSYWWELAHLRGTTPAISGAAGGTAGRRDANRAYLAYLDVRYTLPERLQPIRANLLSPGFTFGFGSGDNKPNDGRNSNFDQLFVDEASFKYNFLFSDDIHGFNGRGFDTRRGGGFTNITFVQPYLLIKPTPKLETRLAWTYLTATVPQPAGTGPLGPAPVLNSALAYSTTAVPGDATRDVGQELDVLVDYFVRPTARLFAYGGGFFPGRIYAPHRENAIKFETGLELRF